MPRRLLSLSVLLLVAAGCGPSTASVSGTVTLNGQPLAKGIISLIPEDDQGTAGEDVVAGRYRITQLKPGRYRVHVAGVPDGPIVQPGSEKAKRTLTEQEIRVMIDPLPPDVTGNGQIIEVRAGEQTHDIKLESRSRP